jgi:glycosyltransferase involved in cell wall biosynthesis
VNILHTVAPAQFGGLEDVVLRLSGGLRRLGHRVSVLAVLDESGSHEELLRAFSREGIDVQPLRGLGRRYAHEIRSVRDALRQEAPDVVHTHGYHCDVLHGRAARQLGLPRVTTLHGFTGGDLKNRLYEWVQLRAIRSFEAVVAVSTPMADVLRGRGIPGRVLHVIRNAWRPTWDVLPTSSARSALEVSDEAFHIGWVGRLSREKGADVLLEALARLEPRGNVVVSIVGDGPMRSSLEERARQLGIGGLRFHGALPQAGRFFAGFDLFVLSSRTEGTPIVLFEAMAASVPIVATRVGGVPDVISPRCAVLVPPEDPAALAAGIQQVRGDPAAATARCVEARRVLDEAFSEGPWLEKYERLYASVLRS